MRRGANCRKQKQLAATQDEFNLCCDINPSDPDNPYVASLAEALTNHGMVQVELGSGGFWSLDYSTIDVLHIQWAEILCGWKDPGEAGILKIKNRLQDIARTTSIVFTVHNLDLKADFGPCAEELMNVVGMHTAAFVHLSNASIDSFRKRYGIYEWVSERPHYVICHGDYSFYRRGAQTDFSVPSTSTAKFTVLVFGGLRTTDELKLTLDVADGISEMGGRMLIAGPVSDHVLHWKERKRLEDEPELNVVRVHRRIPSSEICSLLDQIDIILIPRIGRLNSGVLFLGYSFGIPVVAPNEFTHGEVQALTRSPVYIAGNAPSAVDAIRSLTNQTTAQRVCNAQRVFAYKQKNMSWGQIAKEHVQIYQKSVWELI